MVPFRGLLYIQERNNLYRFSALPRQFYKRSAGLDEQYSIPRAVSHFSFESRRSRTRDLRAWQWGIDYEYCPPFFLKDRRASETQALVAFSRVGWFSRALAFRSRSIIPEEKWGTTRSLNEERIACVAWRFWFCAQSKKGGRGQRNRELSTAPDKTAMPLACENIRFSTLFAAGDVSSPRNVPSAEELNGCFRRLPCYAG